MNKNEAEQIAGAISLIRPDWLRSSMITMLHRHAHRPARDVMLALTWIAYDPDTRGPGRIDNDGPWWQTSRLAGTEPDTSRLPYYEPYTPPNDPDYATPDQIRAIRQQYASPQEDQ